MDDGGADPAHRLAEAREHLLDVAEEQAGVELAVLADLLDSHQPLGIEGRDRPHSADHPEYATQPDRHGLV